MNEDERQEMLHLKKSYPLYPGVKISKVWDDKDPYPQRIVVQSLIRMEHEGLFYLTPLFFEMRFKESYLQAEATILEEFMKRAYMQIHLGKFVPFNKNPHFGGWLLDDNQRTEEQRLVDEDTVLLAMRTKEEENGSS